MADTTFGKKPFIESEMLIANKLSGATYRVVEMLSACASYHDNAVILPPVKELANMLGIGLSTVYRCLNRIQEVLPFLRFNKSASFITAYRTDPDNPKNFFDYQNQESFRVQENYFLNFRKFSQNVENQQLELLPDKAFDSPKTIKTDQTPQTREEVDEKINIKEPSEEEIVYQSQKKEIKYDVLPNHQKEEKVSSSVTQNKYDIPQDLLEKLRMFEVKTSEQVLLKISEHHISQAYGAIAHVENTFETIRDKTAVFLYQLPKQPAERLGQRYDDAFLEKQKQEIERIAKEKENPSYFEQAASAFQTIKESLAALQKPPARGISSGNPSISAQKSSQ